MKIIVKNQEKFLFTLFIIGFFLIWFLSVALSNLKKECHAPEYLEYMANKPTEYQIGY